MSCRVRNRSVDLNAEAGDEVNQKQDHEATKQAVVAAPIHHPQHLISTSAQRSQQ